MNQNIKIALILIFSISFYAHSYKWDDDLLGVHLWRQAQNQWNIINFYRYDNNILRPRIAALNLGHESNILRYEFPIMTWSIAQIERIFGEGIAVTRISMWIVGICMVFGFFKIAHFIFKNEIIALCGTISILFSPIIHYYMINPMSDVWALCAMMWMVYFILKYHENKDQNAFLIASILWMISSLMKLPYTLSGMMILVPVWIAFRKQQITKKDLFKIIGVLALLSIPTVAWYSYAISAWQGMNVLSGIAGTPITMDVILNYLRFHLLDWLALHLVSIPATILFVIGLIVLLIKLKKWTEVKTILLLGFLPFFAYYIFEFSLIARIHDYYLLPFMLWIHLIVCLGISLMMKKKWLKPILIFLILSMPMSAVLQSDRLWSINRNGYPVEWFYQAEALRKAVPRDSLCIFINDNTGTVLPYQAGHRGYVFDHDELPPVWVEDMIVNRRASYLYSTTRKVDTSEVIRKFIDQEIFQADRLKVFKLKERSQIKMSR